VTYAVVAKLGVVCGDLLAFLDRNKLLPGPIPGPFRRSNINY